MPMFDWLKHLFLGRPPASPKRPDKPKAPPDVDLGQQRTAHHQNLAGMDLASLTCPECGAAPGAVVGSYLAAAIAADETITDTFLIGSDFVYYCPACPTVVVDTAELDQYVGHFDDVVGTVRIMGYVDLDAIPESQRHLPLEEIDVPLVPFLVEDRQIQVSAPKRRRQSKRRPKRRR